MNFKFVKGLLAGLVPLSLALSSCQFLNAVDRVRETTESPNPQASTTVITSTDAQSQLVLPQGWKADKELHEKAELQAANRVKEMYVIVLTESKADFQDMTIAKHSELTRGLIIEGLKSPKVTGPTQLTINGSPGLQYEIQGTIDNLNVVYLHTTVETAKNFHQILTWTLRSRFENNRSQLQAVTESFREIAAKK